MSDCGCDDTKAGELAASAPDEMDETVVPRDPRGTKITRWRTLLAPIGKPTGDKRRFAAQSLTNRDLPIPLKWQRSSEQGHTSSVVIGTCDKITYSADGAPTGEGILFTPDPEQLPRLAEDVAEATLLLQQKAIGPSVDLDDMEFHVLEEAVGELAGQEGRPAIEVTKGRISAATLVPIPAFAETGPSFELYEVDAEPEDAESVVAAMAAVGGEETGEGVLADLVGDMDDEEFETFAALVEELDQASPDDAEFGARFAKLKAALAKKPGIYDPEALAATIGRRKYGKKGFTKLREGVAASKVKPLAASLVSALRAAGWSGELLDDNLVAASLVAPTLPPAEWFTDPGLDKPTPITVTEDGRVFGHLASWNTCHTGRPGMCVTPPKSRTDYAYFHTGEVLTDEGAIAVGRISLGGGHPDTRLGFQAAVEHYDSTSTCVATVRAGQDKHGIWVAGATVPGLSGEKVAELRRSPLSGDWRRIGGQLELVHALAVNSPGFPVPRGGMVASGAGEVQMGLVAASVVAFPDPQVTFDLESVQDTMRATVRETIAQVRAEEQRRVAALALADTIEREGELSALARRRQQAQEFASAF